MKQYFLLHCFEFDATGMDIVLLGSLDFIFSIFINFQNIFIINLSNSLSWSLPLTSVLKLALCRFFCVLACILQI